MARQRQDITPEGVCHCARPDAATGQEEAKRATALQKVPRRGGHQIMAWHGTRLKKSGALGFPANNRLVVLTVTPAILAIFGQGKILLAHGHIIHLMIVDIGHANGEFTPMGGHFLKGELFLAIMVLKPLPFGLPIITIPQGVIGSLMPLLGILTFGTLKTNFFHISRNFGGHRTADGPGHYMAYTVYGPLFLQPRSRTNDTGKNSPPPDKKID